MGHHPMFAVKGQRDAMRNIYREDFEKGCPSTSKFAVGGSRYLKPRQRSSFVKNLDYKIKLRVPCMNIHKIS